MTSQTRKRLLRSAVVSHEDFWPDTPAGISAVHSYCASMREVCDTMTNKMIQDNKRKYPHLTEQEIREMVGRFKFQVKKIEWDDQ